jgi:abequosyltransferase
MSSDILLSICIPTFNREAFLRECLDSIFLNLKSEFYEVIVSDNKSTDNTIEVLEEYKEKLPLRWIVQHENIGFDRNFDAVVSNANGVYCWVVGSDDVILADSILKIINIISQREPDIIQFGFINTDISLGYINREIPNRASIKSDLVSFASHVRALPSLSHLFMFISSFIFKKKIWMEKRSEILKWEGSNYIHVGAMHIFLSHGASLWVEDDCFVKARGGNINAFNSVPGKFINLDANTVYCLIMNVYKNNDYLVEAIGILFRRSYPFTVLISTAARGGFDYLVDVERHLLMLGYSRNFLKLLHLANELKIFPLVKKLLIYRRWLINLLTGIIFFLKRYKYFK